MDPRTKVFRAHRSLAWFYAVLGIGLFAVASFGAGGNVGVSVLPVLLMFAGGFAAHYFTARACRQGKEGGRVASIAISCLMLIGFPIGTLIAIYLLANTWKPWAYAAAASRGR